MPLSSGEDSDDGMNNLAMADFLDHIHSSDDEDSQPVTKPSKSVSKVETSKDVNCAEQRGNVAEPAHAANNNLPNKPNPVLRPFQAPQRSESSRVEEPTLITNAQCDGGEERDPVSTEIEDGEHAFGEIDLASIRAVYKEEAGNSQTLDDVLCSPEEYETRQLRENSLPVTKSEVGFGLDAFVLENVASETECCSLIKAVEDMGFSFWNPASDRKDYRNADTVEVTNQVLADRLWGRIKHLCVPSVTISLGQGRWSKELEGTWEAIGVNPNMLFNRYGPGGHFSPHTDGYTIIDYNVRSMYSCLLYLNNCPEGGATRMMEESGDALTDHSQERFLLDEEGRHRFEDHRVRASVSPEPGKLLLFFQDTLHEGEPVGAGHEKYMIRTDILYQRTPKQFDSPTDREAYALFREAELTEAEDATKAAKMFMRFARMAPALAEVYGI